DLRIEFKYDKIFQPISLIFKTKLIITTIEITMGTTTTEQETFIEYSLDLNEILIRDELKDYTTGYFGGEDTCGFAYIDNYYTSVIDDPWNSYTSKSTKVVINNCGIELARRVTSNGGSSYIYSGNFIQSTLNDEVIYAGNTEDLLGLREGINAHWACYSIDNDIVSEEWYISPPWKFVPYFYHYDKNAIVGIVNGLSVHLLGCETGTYIDSIPLDHIMYDKTFLIYPRMHMPKLFGQLKDTIYIYNLDIPTGIYTEDDIIPMNYQLFQNYPNPFNLSTKIEYTLPKKSHVKLKIFNILGQEIATLLDAEQSSRLQSVIWNGRDKNGREVSSGVYLYQIVTDEFSNSKKMLLIK
ncbi:MAG: T9SS type A sorting domain-containing protein, partial [bacterium]